jgi:hypothetical protein
MITQRLTPWVTYFCPCLPTYLTKAFLFYFHTPLSLHSSFSYFFLLLLCSSFLFFWFERVRERWVTEIESLCERERERRWDGEGELELEAERETDQRWGRPGGPVSRTRRTQETQWTSEVQSFGDFQWISLQIRNPSNPCNPWPVTRWTWEEDPVLNVRYPAAWDVISSGFAEKIFRVISCNPFDLFWVMIYGLIFLGVF